MSKIPLCDSAGIEVEVVYMLESISRNLYLLRSERKLSQRKAAKDLGISQALLSHYENGLREPGLAFINRACDYYEVSADFMLGRSAVRDGSAILAEETPKEDPATDNKAQTRIYLRLLVNTMTILFDLLGKLEDKEILRSAYQYLGTGLYRMYRHLAQFCPDGQAALFEVDDLDFVFGASRADMTISELEYVRALQHRKDAKRNFPSAGYQALRKLYPNQYSSLFQVIYTGGRRVAKMLDAHQEKQGELSRPDKNEPI